MADGSITFSTELDNSGIQKDLNAAKREIEKATKSLQDSKNAKIPLVEQVKELEPALKKAKAELWKLARQKSALEIAVAAPEKPELWVEDTTIVPGLSAAKRETEKATKSLQYSKNAKIPLVEQAEKLKENLQKARKELTSLERAQQAAQADLNGPSLALHMDAYDQLPSLNDAVDKQSTRVSELQKQWDAINDKIDKYDQEINQASNSIAQQQQKLTDSLSAKSTAFEEQDRQVEELQKELDTAKAKLEQYNGEITQANNAMAEQQQIAGDLSAKLMSSSSGTAKSTQKTASATQKANREMSKMAQATAKVHQSADHIGKRMSRIVSQVFLFGMVSKALYGVAEYMGKALKGNKEFTAELAKLKGALLTAFQPIYEVLVPALMALMRIATSVAQAIARVFSLITGKSTSEYAKNAKALYEQANATESVGKAAEKAKKSLAGFDEINQLSSDNDTAGVDISGEASAPDFSGFDTAEYKAKIDELVVYISAALLVLGIILVFSGWNIPLGIGLIAAGAIGLATEATVNWGAMRKAIEEKSNLIAGISGILLVIGLILALSGWKIPLGIGLIAVGAVGLATAAAVNWDSISQALQGPIGSVTAVTSALLLAIGMILAFSGWKIPLGIGLIAAGAVGLATTAAVNWSSIVQALRGPIGGIVAIASTALLAIGLILVCSGWAIPLGIALIAAGAAGLVTVAAINWNFIKEKLSDMWSGIKQWWSNKVAPFFTKEYWQEKFATIADGFSNSWKNGINAAIDIVNKFIGWINDKLHLRWDALKIGDWEITSAVDYQLFSIPQIPHLAKGAVLPANKPFLAMVGDQTHGTNVEAPLSTIQEAVAIVMEDMVQSNVAGFEATIAVLREILEAVLGIEIGDDVIGRAAARYNQRLAIRTGGARV